MRVRLRSQAPAPTHQHGRPRPRPQAASAQARDERRLREAGGPEDVCQYACSCGYVFEAEVTTSVRCPHCGVPQAW